MSAKPEIIIYKKCSHCFFKRVDNGTYGSGYPYCSFPDLPPLDNPDPTEIVEALKNDTVPRTCKLRGGGVLFEVSP